MWVLYGYRDHLGIRTWDAIMAHECPKWWRFNCMMIPGTYAQMREDYE